MGLNDRGGEANVGVERILGSNGYEVVLNFFLAGIFARPIAIGFKGVGVEVTEDCKVLDWPVW